MSTSDGLSRSQISRITRVELTRYRRKQQGKHRSSFVFYIPLILLLTGIILVMFGAILMVETRWSPGTENSYSRLPDLDEQAPSITIYGGKE